jgi:16S rRNA (cytosine967-C5)-methyltransferase
LKDQAEVLDRAAGLVRPGGRITYVTCSVLAEENGDQIRAFVERQPSFAVVPVAEVVRSLGDRAGDFSKAVVMTPEGLLMTPRRTDTDGFFVSVLKRS